MSQTINLTQAAIQPEDVKKAAKATPVRDFLRSQVAFFYLVLLIFIVVSVTESGDFFNKAITHDVFFGILGYAVATVFDLFSLVCMIARMNASRIADKRGMFLALVGVIVCAGVSAFANVASAVQDYQVNQFSNIPAWMQQVSPYLGLVFPGMVIVVTLIADHIGDLNPQKADSVEKYRIKEQKKIELLRVRLDIEKQRFAVQKEIAMLHKKPSKKEQTDYKKLLGEATQNHQKIVADLQANYDAHINNLCAKYDDEINDLTTQIATLNSLIQAFENSSQEPHTDEIETVGESVDTSDTETVDSRVTFLNTKRGGNNALQKARRALKNNPDMRATDLARRLKISPSYASQLRAKVLKDA